MKNKNLPLIIGISLPIVFIIIIAFVIYIPSLFVKPLHNFIYTVDGNSYSYNQDYRFTHKVEDNRVVTEPVVARGNVVQTKDLPNLYLYNVKTNSSHQISLSEAQSYLVDPGPSSPDGFTVAYQYGNGNVFDLIGSSPDNRGYFISKGNSRSRLDGLVGNTGYGAGNFRLIGWIK
jgi:hypothetical protein